MSTLRVVWNTLWLCCLVIVARSTEEEATFATSSSPKAATPQKPGGCGSNPVTLDYLRCISALPSCVQLPPGYITAAVWPHGNETVPLQPPIMNCTKPQHVSADTLAKCQFRWISDAERYEGLERVIYVGDSTIMRDYMHTVNATAEEYATKVAKLETGFLAGKVVLSVNRSVEILFYRLLHVSTGQSIIDDVFRQANAKTLIVLTIGPHDTSWLVFRKPMPFYKKYNVGRMDAAFLYWRRHTNKLATHVGAWLQKFGPTPSSRPFFVIREQYWANCNHIKYSKYPLITRCKDLLMPKVIPYYREYTQASFGALGIPVVGIDPLFHKICYLIDAGHVNRWPCKMIELGMLFQAYQLGRQANVLQGFYTTPRVGASPAPTSASPAGRRKPPSKPKRDEDDPNSCVSVLDPWPGALNWVPYLNRINNEGPQNALPTSEVEVWAGASLRSGSAVAFDTGFAAAAAAAAAAQGQFTQGNSSTPPLQAEGDERALDTMNKTLAALSSGNHSAGAKLSLQVLRQVQEQQPSGSASDGLPRRKNFDNSTGDLVQLCAVVGALVAMLAVGYFSAKRYPASRLG